MINENIKDLMDEIEIEEEFKFIKEEFDEESLEKLAQSSKQVIKQAAGTATHLTVSGLVSGSSLMAGHTILGPILGAITGGFVSPIVVGLITALMNYKKIIEFYKKQLSNIRDPNKRNSLQSKINNLSQKLTEKRLKLNKAKTNLINQTTEMRTKINELEKNKNNLSPTELATLEKYKKIVSNRMKVIPRLNA